MRKPKTPPGTDRTYRLALALARRLTTEQPGLLPMLTPILERLTPCRAGPGFGCIRWYGQTYAFTATQARVVGILWKAAEQGVPGVRQETLLAEADSESGRLIDLFRDHPAWGVLIVPGAGRGTFQLAAGP